MIKALVLNWMQNIIKALVINFLWSTICVWFVWRRTGSWLLICVWVWVYLCKSECICQLQIWLHFFFEKIIVDEKWWFWRVGGLVQLNQGTKKIQLHGSILNLHLSLSQIYLYNFIQFMLFNIKVLFIFLCKN